MSLFSVLLQTAERTNRQVPCNNYIYQRHLFAYKQLDPAALHGQHVLELGSGDGYGMRLLAPHALTYLAIDKEEPGKFFIKPGASFMKADLACLQHFPDGVFDTVICFQVIEHIAHDRQLLREIRRLLKPGGLLLLTTPNRLMSLSKNPYHVREYCPDEMAALIGSAFPKACITGIYGNNKVMDYYTANKSSVARFRRFDILGLEHRLPAWLLRWPYNLMNTINRRVLRQQAPSALAQIQWTDFYTGPLNPFCLDYLVTAQK